MNFLHKRIFRVGGLMRMSSESSSPCFFSVVLTSVFKVMPRLNLRNFTQIWGFLIAWVRQSDVARRIDVNRSTVSRFFLQYNIMRSASELPRLAAKGQRHVNIFQYVNVTFVTED